MGRYSDIQKEALQDKLLNDVTENDKIESLQEVLNLLSATDDGTTKLAAVIDARVTAGITAAIGDEGAITSAISAAFTAALGVDGAITNAISAAITAAIGENGSIETWADGRYEAKSS